MRTDQFLTPYGVISFRTTWTYEWDNIRKVSIRPMA